MKDQNSPNFRKTLLDKLIPYFQKDERYFLMVCDMGFGAIDRMDRELPGRVINCGIMEQGTVGIAAGMSLTGCIPVVYSIVNFLVFRSIEQIRNDVVIQNLNVKFIGTGANDYFKFLGKSHCCGDDDKKIMSFIGMPVYDPYESENIDFDKMVDDWIMSEKYGYLRV